MAERNPTTEEDVFARSDPTGDPCSECGDELRAIPVKEGTMVLCFTCKEHEMRYVH